MSSGLPDLQKYKVLVFSPKRDEYKIVNHVNFFLDNWSDHENAVDDDWRVVSVHENESKLRFIKFGMQIKRQITLLNKTKRG